MNFDSESVLSEKSTEDEAWKKRAEEVLLVELLFQSTKRASRLHLRLLPEANNNSPNWKPCPPLLFLDDDEDMNCRVKGAMMPSSSSHRLLLEEKRKAVDGAKLKKISFAVFLFLIREEKEEMRAKNFVSFSRRRRHNQDASLTRIYTHKWATTGACRVLTGAALGGAVGGAVGASYGTYEAFAYKVCVVFLSLLFPKQLL